MAKKSWCGRAASKSSPSSCNSGGQSLSNNLLPRWSRVRPHRELPACGTTSSGLNCNGRSKVDKGTFGGVLLAIAGILAGLLLEGGRIAQMLQPTAAMIVFGGTIGAVLVQFPLPTVIQATKSLAHVFRDANRNPKEVV